MEDGESVLISFASDMNAELQHTPVHLLLTDLRLVVMDGANEISLAPKEIKDTRVAELYGHSRIEVDRHGQGDSISLLHFSRHLTPEFAAICHGLKMWSEGKDILMPKHDGGSRCAQCNDPLPQRGANCPSCMSRSRVLKDFYRFISPYRNRVFLGVAMTLAAVICQMIPPLVERALIDDIFMKVSQDGFDAEAAISSLFTLAFVMACTHLGFSLFGWIGNITNSWLSDRVIADMRAALHLKLQQVSMSYHNRHESGQLISRVMQDTQELRHFLIEGVPFLLINMLSFVAIGGILFWINPMLALVAVAPVPLLVFGGIYFWKRLIPLFHQRGSRVGALHSVVGESIKGIRSIKAASRTSQRQDQFASINQGYFSISFRVNRTFIGFFVIMAVMMGISITLIWAVGGLGMIQGAGSISIGDMTAFVHLVALFHAPIKWLAAVVNWLTHSMASAERLLHILDQKDESDGLKGDPVG